MGGGVILIDYDRDGWPDIYFTNNPSVDQQLKGQRVFGALYHNNHNGTFTDVTAKSGLDSPCYGMGGAVGDYNNDGWPDLYLTCLGGNILYRNNGDGTFTRVYENDWKWQSAFAGRYSVYVSAITRQSIYDDQAAFSSNVWALPYVVE